MRFFGFGFGLTVFALVSPIYAQEFQTGSLSSQILPLEFTNELPDIFVNPDLTIQTYRSNNEVMPLIQVGNEFDWEANIETWVMRSITDGNSTDAISFPPRGYIYQLLANDPNSVDFQQSLEARAVLGDPVSVELLYRNSDISDPAEALGWLESADAKNYGGIIGDLELDLASPNYQNALEAYSAAANNDLYSSARLAQLSLNNPGLDYALTDREAIATLQLAAIGGEMQGFIGLIEQTKSDAEKIELYLASLGLASNPQQDQTIQQAVSLICNVNVDVNDCPTLPLFYVTDRQFIKVANRNTFTNSVVDESPVNMGFSKHYLQSNTFISEGQLSALEFAGKKVCGEDGASILGCSDQFQPLDITGPAISDPTNDISIFVQSVSDFATDISGDSGNRRIILLFHGYNNSFDAAANRFTDLMEKAEYPAVPIIFSFASANGDWAYKQDLEISHDSCVRFRPIVEALVEAFGAENVDVVAHSMGGNIVYEMAMGCPETNLDTGPLQPWKSLLFRSVIFGAPDIDTARFQEDYTQFRIISEYFTLYTSTNDLALEAANFMNKTNTRLGQAGENRISLPSDQRTMIIDSTGVEFNNAEDAINHGYLLLVSEVRRDLAMLVNGFFEDTVVRCISPSNEKPYFYILPRCNL